MEIRLFFSRLRRGAELGEKSRLDDDFGGLLRRWG